MHAPRLPWADALRLLSSPVSADEALTKGRVCAFKPTVMYILYNAAM